MIWTKQSPQTLILTIFLVIGIDSPLFHIYTTLENLRNDTEVCKWTVVKLFK